MASTAAPQSYRNHARNVPLFHYFTLPVLIANVMFAVGAVVDGVSTDSVVALLVAAALFMTALYARVFALRAQDRVIRLEERLRMRELLPPDLQPRINDFSVDQLVALRFASDAELPALAAKVLHDDVRTRKEIKQLVSTWKADHVRV